VRALLITAPNRATVADVEPPRAGPGQIVVDVRRAGVCGTDTALAMGEPERMAHLGNTFPMRLGHEWCGVVASVGDDVDPAWIGRRVTGDTMIGCGHCARCLGGRHHLCEARHEIGIRAWPGALAEQVLVPFSNIHALPDAIDDDAGAMVEPGANAWRAVDAAGVRAGHRVLVIGPGAIGLIAAQMARARGADVHLFGRNDRNSALARSVGLDPVWEEDSLPDLSWSSVIDASNASASPRRAFDLVETGGRVALIGMAGEESRADARPLVRKEVTVVGLLGGSAGIGPTIDAYASGEVTVAPLVQAVLSLEEAATWFGGAPVAGPGVKILVDPQKDG